MADEAHASLIHEGEDLVVEEATAEVARTPPGDPATPVFKVRALSWESGEHPAATLAPTPTPILGQLRDDGTFVIQVPPGRYALEARSDDGILIAGLEVLTAIAGEARGDLELTLSDGVSLAGRLVDDDGSPITGELQLEHVHLGTSAGVSTDQAGRFVFDGLRPGTYALVGSRADVSSAPVQLRAPAANVQIRVPRLATAMLLVPRLPDGTCPRGRVTLRAPKDEHLFRRASFFECRALIFAVPPGSSWYARGSVDGRSIEATIVFDSGRTLAPVCLGAGCDTDVAAVEPRIVAADGTVVTGAKTRVVDSPTHDRAPQWSIDPLTPGFRAGFSYTFAVEAGPLQGRVTSWLVPGVNRVVVPVY